MVVNSSTRVFSGTHFDDANCSSDSKVLVKRDLWLQGMRVELSSSLGQVIENSLIVTKMCTGLHRLVLNRSIEMKCIDLVEAVKAYS